MGNLVSVRPPPSDTSFFGKIIIDVEKMTILYETILNEANSEGAGIDEIRVDHFLSHMKILNDAMFNRIAADPRIIQEAYRHVADLAHKKFKRQQSEKPVVLDDEAWAAAGFQDPASTNGMESSASTPSFRKGRSSRSVKSQRNLKHMNSEKYVDADLYLSKEEFFSFLPTIYLFSMLWEVFISTDTNIGNALITKGEYSGAFKRLHSMPGVEFKESLTKEMWDAEFKSIDKNKSGDITFRELCKYTVKKVVAPMDYLKVVGNKFYYYDMDADAGPLGGGLPCGELRGVLPTEYAATLLTSEELDAKPVALTAAIFLEGSEEADPHCEVKKDTARMVCRDGAPLLEFQVQLKDGKDEHDVTFYGRRSFQMLLPDGKVASQGDFSLLPALRLQPKAAYHIRDSETGAPITADSVTAVISAKDDPRTKAGTFQMEDVELPVQNCTFRIPYADLPDALLTVRLAAMNYSPAQEFSVVKFRTSAQSEDETVPLQSTFSRLDMGEILAWEKRMLQPPEGAKAHSPHLITATAAATTPPPILCISTSRDGMPESRCLVQVTAVQATGGGAVGIEVEAKLADGADELDISLYGRRDFTVTVKQSGHRVLQGSFMLLPQASLQPQGRYIATNCFSGLPIVKPGRALLTCGGATAGSQASMEVEVQLSGGVLTFSDAQTEGSLLSDCVVSIMLAGIDGYRDSASCTAVLFRGATQREMSEKVHVEPILPWTDIDAAAGCAGAAVLQEVVLGPSEYAASVLHPYQQRIEKQPLALVSVLSVHEDAGTTGTEEKAMADSRYTVTATVRSSGGKLLIEFTVKFVSGIDPLDLSLYGCRRLSLFLPGQKGQEQGRELLRGAFNLFPSRDLQTRAAYQVRNSFSDKAVVRPAKGRVTRVDLRPATAPPAAAADTTVDGSAAAEKKDEPKRVESAATGEATAPAKEALATPAEVNTSEPAAPSSTEQPSPASTERVSAATTTTVDAPVRSGVLTPPWDDFPDGVYTVQAHSIDQYSDSEEVTVVKFGVNAQQAGQGALVAEPVLSWSYLQPIMVQEQRQLLELSEYAQTFIDEARAVAVAAGANNNAPLKLKAILKLVADEPGGGKSEGAEVVDTHCQVIATVVTVDDNSIINMQTVLNKDTDVLDLSVYGPRQLFLSLPVTSSSEKFSSSSSASKGTPQSPAASPPKQGERLIVQASFTLIPQASLQPRQSYLLTNCFTERKFAKSGKATITLRLDNDGKKAQTATQTVKTADGDGETTKPAGVGVEETEPAPYRLELPISSSGVLLFPADDVPYGALIVTVTGVAGCQDGAEMVLLKVEPPPAQKLQQGQLYTMPLPEWSEVEAMTAGDLRAIAYTEHTEAVLGKMALPLQLTGWIQYEDGRADEACEVVASAVNRNGFNAVEFQVMLKSGVDELDIALYGRRKLFINTIPEKAPPKPAMHKRIFSALNFWSNKKENQTKEEQQLSDNNDRAGQSIITGAFTLLPQSSLLPRSKYILRNCTNNMPLSGSGVMVISAKLDPRTKAGTAVMAEMEFPVSESLFELPIDQLPDAVLTITPKFAGFTATDFTVLKFRAHIQGAEMKLFVNPVIPPPSAGQRPECRVVLAWGDRPRDLDIHVTTSNSEHVYFGAKTTRSSSVRLDIDVMSGNGPETLTFKPEQGITYTVTVKNFSNEVELFRSEAVVFYTGFSAEQNFSLRISQDRHDPERRTWACFDLKDDGTCMIINKVI